MRKILIIVFGIITFSCSLKKTMEDDINLERYNNNTYVYIDNLQREKIPDIIKKNYYDLLKNQDYYKAKSTIYHNKRIIEIYSKQAKKGYLFINEYLNKFIHIQKKILIILDSDTLHTKEDVSRYIKLKKSRILSIDTLQKKEFGIIKVRTKKSK